MKELPEEKRLLEILRKTAPFGIAFSGGADSTMLAFFSVKHLGPDAVRLLHAHTPFCPGEERVLAENAARELGVKLHVVTLNLLDHPTIRENDRIRCYHCKKIIMGTALEALRAMGISTLCDGANTDDLSDWRPGMKAADELGVRHPFLEAGLGKRRIRLLARRLGIGNWMLPASACMASRIPCGTPLEQTVLDRAKGAEKILRERLGFRGVRVRCLENGETARVEVRPIDLRRLSRREAEITGLLTDLGFRKVECDPSGYRRGAMNLAEPPRKK